MSANDAQLILAAWALSGAHLEPLAGGHINRTLRVECADGLFALQRLAPIFAPEVCLDIEDVTERLAAHGLITPRLVPTVAGERWARDPAGGTWRLLTWVAGEVHLRTDSPERCREAGALLGRFHAALWDWDGALRHRRAGVHDTPRHLAALRSALGECRDHRLFAEVEPVGRAILEAAADLSPPGDLPLRLVHGDPKISNIVFDPTGRALCLIDLDTLARMPLAVELGDALRSWCFPLGEEIAAPVERAHCRAALEGWAAAIGDRPGPGELVAVAPALARIGLELAARFCADALRESYFGWDANRFASAGEHNLMRARAQLHQARSVRAALPELERIAAEVFGIGAATLP